MIKRVKLIFRGPINPEFRACGLALQNIQFAMFNVVGEGATTGRGAVWKWLKTVMILIKGSND